MCGIATFIGSFLLLFVYTDILTRKATKEYTGDILYRRQINHVDEIKYNKISQLGPISKVLRSFFSNKENDKKIDYSVDAITSVVKQLQKLQNVAFSGIDKSDESLNTNNEEEFVKKDLDKIVLEYLSQVKKQLEIPSESIKNTNNDDDDGGNDNNNTPNDDNISENNVSNNNDNDEICTKDNEKTNNNIEARGETLLWFNTIVSYIAIFANKLSASQDKQYTQYDKKDKNKDDIKNPKIASKRSIVITKLVNDTLQNVNRPQFLGLTQIEYLELGYIFPQIHDITIINSNFNEPIILDIDFSIVTDSVIEVSTALVASIKSIQLIDLPLQLALSNVLLSGRIRIAIDLNIDKPSVAFCFTDTPDIRFDIATAFGNRIQLINIPLLYGLLHKLLLNAINNKLVADNIININILEEYLDELHSKIKNLKSKSSAA